MIAQLSVNDFQGLLHTPCRASVGAIAFDLVIESVQLYQRPLPDPVTRVPFTVLLTGPLEPSFQYGLFALATDSGFTVNDLYIERIVAPLEADKDKAYYQIVFA